MTEAEKSPEVPREITIDGEQYTIVVERLRGVGLYADAGRTRYVRIGTPSMVEKELSFHKELLANGFPIANILAEGTLGDREYWMEESLGEKHFSAIFKEDIERDGAISEASFALWLQHLNAMHDAQEQHAGQPVPASLLAEAVRYRALCAEMPDDVAALDQAFGKLSQELAAIPSCLTHGDLTSHNVLPGGVIDFGDHFLGPLGYDMVNAITVPFWFPKDEANGEFIRKYGFTDEHIARFFKAVGTFHLQDRTVDLRHTFDALFLLKGCWWTVNNFRVPKLQAWRYDVFRELVRRYNAGESLYDYWMTHKDD